MGSIPQKFEEVPLAYITFLSFLPGCLLDAGAYLTFRKLKNIIIFCIHLYEANKLLSRYIFVKCDKELLDNNK